MSISPIGQQASDIARNEHSTIQKIGAPSGGVTASAQAMRAKAKLETDARNGASSQVLAQDTADFFGAKGEYAAATNQNISGQTVFNEINDDKNIPQSAKDQISGFLQSSLLSGQTLDNTNSATVGRQILDSGVTK